MKKKIIFFSLAFLTLFAMFSMLAKPAKAEAGVNGKLVIHYQNWTNQYENTGLWSWNHGNVQSGFDYVTTDSFGGVYEVPLGESATSSVGVIVMDSGYTNGSNYTAWDNNFVKGTSDLTIDVSKLLSKELTEMHVYAFYSPSITADNYFVADPAAANIFVVYFAAEYEETLGVHQWGGFGAADWGVPADVFTESAESPSAKKIMVAHMVNPTPADGGFLVYAGTDADKKTPNNASDSITDLATLALGSVNTLYITANEPYYGAAAYADFVAKAFTFKFEDDTMAMNPETIKVSLSQEVKVKEEYDTGETKPGKGTEKQWFSTGEAFNQTDKTFSAAVLPALTEGQAGRIIFHHQLWNGDYTGTGLWTWGGTTSDGVANIGVDEFGAVSIVEFAATATEIGLIPIKHDIDNDNRWASRETPDGKHITFDVTGLTGDIHLYYFEGGLQTYFQADPEKANVLVVYSAQTYEENLGFHWWGGYGETLEYGTPAQEFVDGGMSPASTVVKVAHLTAANPGDSGFLVYAGTDETKKTPENACNAITEPASITAGQVVVLYITNSTAFYGEDAKADFATSAFAEGEWRDVEVDIQVPVMGTRTRLFKDLFEIVCGEEKVAIKRVDLNESKETVMEFVIVLEGKLDNTKEYTLKYNGESDKIEMAVAMDTEKPEVLIIGDTTVTIKQYTAWDNGLFPIYTAKDDRQGTITNRVYVKSGEGKVNPNVAGSYDIVLTAFDDWGNEGSATFTIVVEELAQESGCNKSASVVMVQLLSAMSLLALVLRKKH